MSFSNSYSKEMFKQDLEKGSVFTFKGKTWILFCLCFFNIFFIGIGISITFFLIGLIPFYAFVIGLIFLGITISSTIYWIKATGRTIEITPEGISWKGGFSSGDVKFVDIEDISYFPSPFLGLHTAKLFLNNNRRYKLRTSLMTGPKNWYSEEMIRTIIDTYWIKVNPDAKYSIKSVISKPSAQPKTISLLKPTVSPQQDEVFQGYKCLNCLVIHDKEHKFCPKCGASME